jgi:hypothetical protein
LKIWLVLQSLVRTPETIPILKVSLAKDFIAVLSKEFRFRKFKLSAANLHLATLPLASLNGVRHDPID